MDVHIIGEAPAPAWTTAAPSSSTRISTAARGAQCARGGLASGGTRADTLLEQGGVNR